MVCAGGAWPPRGMKGTALWKLRLRRLLLLALACVMLCLCGFVHTGLALLAVPPSASSTPGLGAEPWSSVAAAYDRIAENFGESRARPWPFAVRWLRDAEGPRDSPRERLLVAGCGDGRHVVTALELGCFEKIWALDASQGMLDAAMRRLSASPALPAGAAAAVSWLAGDVRQAPSPEPRLLSLPACSHRAAACWLPAGIRVAKLWRSVAG
mmetsp:Transcript_178034/g.565063  ORF Transcript_178034/g.565063 Transcript_178034/m.565063 type:complete len:211 (-) Transcript_178034:228-860(-)